MAARSRGPGVSTVTRLPRAASVRACLIRRAAPQALDVQADVSLGPDPAGGFRLTGIKLTVRGEVEGLDDAQFAKVAQDAKASCPVSKALTGVDITLDAALEH